MGCKESNKQTNKHFLTIINDLPEAVNHSDSRLLVDDCLFYRLIISDADSKRLQEDLEALEKWEKMWQMKFHPEKCQVIRINSNKSFERQSDYRLNGHTGGSRQWEVLGTKIFQYCMHDKLTTYTRPANTCTCPLKAYAIKNIREEYVIWSPRVILPKALVLQDECFGKNYSSFLDFTPN